MDIEQTWQQSGKNDDLLNQMLTAGRWDAVSSKLPLSKLRKNLLYSLVLAAMITAGYAWLLFVVPALPVKIAVELLIVFNLWLIFITWQLYRQISETVSPRASLTEELATHLTNFERWMQVQRKVSLVILPVAIAGGFALGISAGSQKDLLIYVAESKVWGILLITILVLAPICYNIQEWGFKKAYGVHLQKMKSMLEELNGL